MSAMAVLVAKEAGDLVRSGRFITMVLLIAATMVLLAVVVPAEGYQSFMDAREYNPDPPPIDPERVREDHGPLAALSGYLSLPVIGALSLLPLFAMLLCADAVVSERKGGTLGVLLSKPLHRWELVVGKFLARFLLLGGSWLVLFSVTAVLAITVLPEGRAADVLVFAQVAGIVLLGIAAFCAFGILLSSFTRSGAQAVILAVAAWMVIFPAVGTLGLTTSLADPEFQTLGVFDHRTAYDACGAGPAYSLGHEAEVNASEMEEAMDVYDACIAPFEQEQEAYYAAHGLDPVDWSARWDECRAHMDANATEEDRQAMESCTDQVQEEERAYYAAREAILMQKFDRLQVDWSFYATPENPMNLVKVPLNESRWGDFAPRTAFDAFFVGQAAAPASTVVGILALPFWTAAYLGAAAWITIRRDFR